MTGWLRGGIGGSKADLRWHELAASGGRGGIGLTPDELKIGLTKWAAEAQVSEQQLQAMLQAAISSKHIGRKTSRANSQSRVSSRGSPNSKQVELGTYHETHAKVHTGLSATADC